MRIPWVRLAIGVSVALVAGCGDSPTGPELEIFIEDSVQGGLLVGDQRQLEAVLSDPSVNGTVSWSSSDTAVALVDQLGFLRAQRPGTATISIQLNSAAANLPVTVAPRTGGYTAPEIDYLQAIAFGFEYGGAAAVIRKWGVNPRIRVFGTPTTEDMAVLEDVISDLNLLMEEVQVELVDSDPTVEVHFAPIAQFPSILPSYVEGNWGYFSVWFDGASRIYKSVVLLASDVADQEDRNHLLREEVTQMLGLAKDSGAYPNSIFYQGWTTTQSYDPIDEALIEMLYRPHLFPGVGYRQAVDVLRTLTRRGWEGVAPPLRSVTDSLILSLSDSTETQTRRGRGGIGSGGG